MKKNFVFKNNDDYFYKMNKEIGIFEKPVGKSSIYRVSKKFGEGFIERITLRNGIEIFITDINLERQLEYSYKMEGFNFEIVYFVKGWVRFGGKSKKDKFLLNKGNIYYVINEDIKRWMKYPARTKWYCVSINFEELFVKSFFEIPEITINMESFKKMMKKYCGCKSPQIKNPKIKVVFNQILNCNYQGMAKILYLESKAIEIISLFIESEVLAPERDSARVLLKKEDHKKMIEAREVIINNIVNPLTIAELAKKIGINTYKLKVGFKEVYGTTIFGYLRNIRMEKAKQLIISKNKNIMEIAHEVGYSNPSKFSAAFKRKYGINPSELR